MNDLKLNLKLSDRMFKKSNFDYINHYDHIEKCSDLIDNCKYMLYLADDYQWGGFNCIPVKNLNEAVYIIKNSTLKLRIR